MNEKKYIGYIRVSNKEHDTSLPAQKQKLLDYAQEKGIQLEMIYTEEQSAFKANKRKQFKRMISRLEDDDIQGVVFHKVDRSSRNMSDFSLLENFFDTKEILVIEGQFDTRTSHGRFQFRLFCSLAVMYSENLSEEVRLKMRERLKTGYYPCNPPFGYRKGTKKDADPKKKYPDDKAIYVRRMFRMYDTGCYSYRSIASHFSDKGIRMGKDVVEKILSNPFYYGLIRWNHRGNDKPSYYMGNHEPIISENLYKRVEVRRLGRTRNRGYNFSKNPYAKFLNCECGKPLYWERPMNGSGEKKYAYFRCQNKSCYFTSIRNDEFEECLIEQLSSYLCRSKWFSEFEKAYEKYADCGELTKTDTSLLNNELNIINSKLRRLNEGYLEGVFTKEEVLEEKEILNRRKKGLVIDINQLKNQKPTENRISPKRVRMLFKRLSVLYSKGDSQIKRTIMNFCFSNGNISGGKLSLTPVLEVFALASMPNLQNGWGDETSSDDKLLSLYRTFQVDSVVKKFEELEGMAA